MLHLHFYDALLKEGKITIHPLMGAKNVNSKKKIQSISFINQIIYRGKKRCQTSADPSFTIYLNAQKKVKKVRTGQKTSCFYKHIKSCTKAFQKGRGRGPRGGREVFYTRGGTLQAFCYQLYSPTYSTRLA